MADNVVSLFPATLRAVGPIEKAVVQAGARPIDAKAKGVNDTYHGEVLTASGATRFAFIKDLDAGELANELAAAALARMVGAPVPECFLAVAHQANLPLTKAPKMMDGSRLVFASEDAGIPSLKYFYDPADQTVFNRLVEKLASFDTVGLLFGFDTLFANVDRNVGNILVGAQEFWLIDHGRCFTGPAWAAAGLDPAAAYMNRIVQWLTPVLSAEQKSRAVSLASAMASLSDADLDSLMKTCHADGLLSAEKQTALVAFIKARRANLPSMAAKALGLVA